MNETMNAHEIQIKPSCFLIQLKNPTQKRVVFIIFVSHIYLTKIQSRPDILNMIQWDEIRLKIMSQSNLKKNQSKGKLMRPYFII